MKQLHVLILCLWVGNWAAGYFSADGEYGYDPKVSYQIKLVSGTPQTWLDGKSFAKIKQSERSTALVFISLLYLAFQAVTGKREGNLSKGNKPHKLKN